EPDGDQDDRENRKDQSCAGPCELEPVGSFGEPASQHCAGRQGDQADQGQLTFEACGPTSHDVSHDARVLNCQLSQLLRRVKRIPGAGQTSDGASRCIAPEALLAGQRQQLPQPASRAAGPGRVGRSCQSRWCVPMSNTCGSEAAASSDTSSPGLNEENPGSRTMNTPSPIRSMMSVAFPSGSTTRIVPS